MAIYLSRKKGGTVATPITPSNSSPAQMTANVAVNPTANGYAIASYHSITPSNVFYDYMVAGELYKPTKNGAAVESVLRIEPSNSNPVTVLEERLYQVSDTGYVISSYSGITPSNSSPVSLSSGSIYKPSASGYAISSYSSKTPSDSSPASVSSGAIIKASASGYLYASSGLVNMVNITNTASKDTNFTLSSGNTTTVSVTSKPRLILWFQGNYGSSTAAGYGEMGMYDGINNRYRRVTFYSGGANTATDSGDISSVTSSTVSFKNNGSSSRRYHVMMWY